MATVAIVVVRILLHRPRLRSLVHTVVVHTTMRMAIVTAMNVVIYMVILVAHRVLMLNQNVRIAAVLIATIRMATAHIEFTVTNVAKILQLE
jgi:hypothetical protein